MDNHSISKRFVVKSKSDRDHQDTVPATFSFNQCERSSMCLSRVHGRLTSFSPCESGPNYFDVHVEIPQFQNCPLRPLRLRILPIVRHCRSSATDTFKMNSLMLVVFVLQLVIHLVNTIGASTINSLVSPPDLYAQYTVMLMVYSFGISTIGSQSLLRRLQQIRDSFKAIS